MRKEILNSTVELAMACAAEGIDRVYVSVPVMNETYLFEVVCVVPIRDEVIVHGTCFDPGIAVPDTYDEQGGCLRRLRLDQINAVMTPDEYQTYEDCRQADLDMLENAR